MDISRHHRRVYAFVDDDDSSGQRDDYEVDADEDYQSPITRTSSTDYAVTIAESSYDKTRAMGEAKPPPTTTTTKTSSKYAAQSACATDWDNTDR